MIIPSLVLFNDTGDVINRLVGLAPTEAADRAGRSCRGHELT